MALIKVKAAPGIRVPKERSPREYITDDEAVEVNRSQFYLRRLADGDLLLVSHGQEEGQQTGNSTVQNDTTAVADVDDGEAKTQQVKTRKTSQEKAS
ncbi:DUF2635 domain-containing protein [Enterobacter ludwigii]|uniref:DUF2635 domain-containing protein n=1 Tax=Enterobacter ludwigii TaxID=299767 RepID=UPI001953A716|nr:DUF2635 domain-containing protein [Enterobacter ludwigii]